MRMKREQGRSGAKPMGADRRTDGQLLDGLQAVLDSNGSLMIDKKLNPRIKSLRLAIARFLDEEHQ